MLARTFSVVAGFDLTMESAAQARSGRPSTPLPCPACACVTEARKGKQVPRYLALRGKVGR